MKIKDFIERGRELYAICHGNHGEFDPQMDDRELRGKLR
jgi:hypothetical protein